MVKISLVEHITTIEVVSRFNKTSDNMATQNCIAYIFVANSEKLQTLLSTICDIVYRYNPLFYVSTDAIKFNSKRPLMIPRIQKIIWRNRQIF